MDIFLDGWTTCVAETFVPTLLAFIALEAPDKLTHCSLLQNWQEGVGRLRRVSFIMTTEDKAKQPPSPL